MKTHNLLDEPWLPVRFCDGQVREVGLLEAFERSADISALAETAPPSLVAQYRMLLAITHRALMTGLGSWKDRDRAKWYREGLPLDVIRDYLEQWRERFWLFHPEFPFMQVAVLATAAETREKAKPWTQIALASANGNAPVVFDHSFDTQPKAIRSVDALRTLLGFLQFTPGGLVKTVRDSDKAGALANTAAVIPVGVSLAQTLCLALHKPTAEGFADSPAWEMPAPSMEALRADPVLATGPNDRYTRLSRAVLLLQEQDGAVRWIRFAAGIALGDDPNAPDPMASYRAGVNNLVRLTFNEGRALWRDLPALVPDATGQAAQPAAVLGQASNLHKQVGSGLVDQPLLVAGLASDQAKLLRWRSEQLVLPANLLDDTEKALLLRSMIGKAESLYSDFKSLAVPMLAETLPDSRSKDTRSRARSLIDAGPAGPLFFAAAEREVATMLELLATDCDDEAEACWQTALRAAALQAWNAVVDGMGRSPRAMAADGKYWPRIHGLLNKHFPTQDLAREARA